MQTGSFDKNDWQAIQLTPEWHSWVGYAFEAICYKHLKQIKRALGLTPMSLASTWRYAPRKHSKKKGAQIDLLFDRRDDTISICEIKHSNKPFVISKDYAQILKQKLSVFKQQTKTKKQLLIAFISANGIKDNPQAKALVNGVVDIDDLFCE